MPNLVQAVVQTKWPDCYASSVRVGLTVRSNGEEAVTVYTQNQQLVQAGFDAPTVVPTVTSAAGAIPIGYYVYFYVYASSQYPNVDSGQTAGGYTWPRSNPSPPSSVIHFAVASQATVTVTKSTRSDVDRILIYRSPTATSSADATGFGVAGQAYYAGYVVNDGIAGTATYVDNAAAAQEQMELDNYIAPQFWVCVYEDPYWWGFGNPKLDVGVTLSSSTSIITISTGQIFSGRNGQQVNFDGITSGGYNEAGTFYLKVLDTTHFQVFRDASLSTPFLSTIPADGTTVAHIRGYSSTLYRSKPRDPFGWGWILDLVSSDGTSVTEVPQQYAFPVGGDGVAIAVLPEEKLLKLDCENPSRCYTLNLALAGNTDGSFEASKRILDTRYTCSSHHSQFNVSLPNGQKALQGMDALNYSVIRATGAGQQPCSDNIFQFLQGMTTANDLPRQIHGVYDPFTQLSSWWITTTFQNAAAATVGSDSRICYHGPSDQWSISRDFDITASASIYDPLNEVDVVVVGTQQGRIHKLPSSQHADVPQIYYNVHYNNGTLGAAFSSANPQLTDSNGSGVGVAGDWVLLPSPTDAPDRDFWCRLTDGISQVDVVFEDDYLSRGTGGVYPFVSAAADFQSFVSTGNPFFTGCIACEVRSYFQPDQTKAVSQQEVWATFENPYGPTAGLQLRFYDELDDVPSTVTTITQDVRTDGTTPSIGYYNRTLVPSRYTRQFGLGIVERGQFAFTVLGFDLKAAGGK